MWLQKKETCPICKININEIVSIYYPSCSNYKNNKLSYLFNTIENLKFDNYGKFSKKCLICGKEDPKDQLISCNFCNYFQEHFLCDLQLD